MPLAGVFLALGQPIADGRVVVTFSIKRGPLESTYKKLGRKRP